MNGKNLILDKFCETLRSLLSWNICKKLMSVDNKEEALSEFEFQIVKKVFLLDSTYENEAKRIILEVLLLFKAKNQGNLRVLS